MVPRWSLRLSYWGEAESIRAYFGGFTTTMFKTRFAMGIGLLSAAVVAAAFVADYTLNYSPKVGTTTKYKMSGVFDFEGTEIMFTASTSNKVLEVKANGDYVIEEVQDNAKVSFGGQEMDAPSGGPNRTTFSPSGKVVDMQGDMVDGSAYRTAGVSSFYKPTKAVKVGDSWKIELKGDSKLGSVDSVASYTVEAEEAVGAWQTLRIAFDVKETTGSQPASSSGKIWIDHRDGEMVKVEGRWKDVPVPGAPAPITGTMKVIRL